MAGITNIVNPPISFSLSISSNSKNCAPSMNNCSDNNYND